MQQFDTHAENIKCGGCATNIKTGLMALDGISQVEVEIDSGQVHVEGEHLDENSIRQKLTELGYPPR